jgi:hypothetical protein
MKEAHDAILTSVHERFARLARAPERERAFPIGPESAKRLGYAAQAIQALPPSATESFAGVGNPLSLGKLQPGAIVLGVDMVPEMLSKAQHNAQAVGLTNVVFLPGSADALAGRDTALRVAPRGH